MNTDHQRPEGALIAAGLKRSKLSARKAADLAGISDARWRQIVNGYQSVGAGQVATVVGPAETIARMARVVGVTADQLNKADRPDAAAALADLETVSTSTDDGAELRYRRPEGMGDEQWERIRARGQAYIEGLIDSAAQER